MKKMAAFAFFVFLTGYCLAQPAREQLDAARIGLITSRINLTPEQSTKFWPVYNEYNGKKGTLRRSLRQLKMEDPSATATDNKIRQDLQEMLSLRQKEVDLEKEYMHKLLKVISPRQVAELYKAEQEFTRLMLNRLEQRRAKRQQH